MPHVSPSICLDLPWASRFVKTSSSSSSVRRRDRREERRRYLRGNRGAADNEQEELGRRKRRVIYRRTSGKGGRGPTSLPGRMTFGTYGLPIFEEVNLLSSYFISEGIHFTLHMCWKFEERQREKEI